MPFDNKKSPEFWKYNETMKIKNKKKKRYRKMDTCLNVKTVNRYSE